MRLFRLLAVGVVLAAVLTGCSTPVALDPAEKANDPRCADVSVRFPDTIGGEDRRWTDAQATGAWGDPTAIIVRCGLEPPAPTAELQCVTVSGVDWLVDDSEYPMFRLTSYGRTPAVQAYVNREAIDPTEVLSALSNAVGTLPADGSCVAPDAPATPPPA